LDILSDLFVSGVAREFLKHSESKLSNAHCAVIEPWSAYRHFLRCEIGVDVSTIGGGSPAVSPFGEDSGGTPLACVQNKVLRLPPRGVDTILACLT
jgi:hypothetical protein